MKLLKSTLLVLLLLITSNYVWGSESSLYNFSWLDQDKEVYVLQNRKFRKVGHFHFFGGLGITVNGKMVDSTSVQARANYFIHEEWGIELLYAMNQGSENEVAKSVRNSGGIGSIPFRRIVDTYTGGMVLWSPFYGKINTFNSLVYFDLIFGLGLAKLTEENNRTEFESNGAISGVDNIENHTALLWEIGAMFYLNKTWSVRVDLTALHYKAQTALSTASENDEEIYSNYDATVSVGLSF